MCHQINEDIVGPKLKGVTEKREYGWLVKVIRNGDELISSGDSLAVILYLEWNKTQHPPHDIKDKKIDAILVFLHLKRSRK